MAEPSDEDLRLPHMRGCHSFCGPNCKLGGPSCDCGADELNAAVDKLLTRLRAAIKQSDERIASLQAEIDELVTHTLHTATARTPTVGLGSFNPAPPEPVEHSIEDQPPADFDG